ncbi:MAG: nucleoside hydrolase, partial [Pseudomonadales bacterium]
NLLGVTTVYGNAPLDLVNRAAQELLTVKDASIPIVSGAVSATRSGSNDAVEFMAEQLGRQRLHIAAIGPLTNVGLLVKRYPERIANIESVVIVAGRSQGRSFFIGDQGPVNDFNFENDAMAARALLESGVCAVLAGFELTSQVTVTARDLYPLTQQGGVGLHCYQRCQDWMNFWLERFPEDNGIHPWDSAAIAWLSHPEWFIAEQRGWRLRQEGEVPQLETDRHFDGKQVTFLTGFTGSGAADFVQNIVSNIR